MPNISSACKTPNSSSNRKSVLLHKWWLIKVENESKLGVGGFANRETLGSLGRRLLGSASYGKRGNLETKNQTENKVFFSAAIVKRLDNNTLETVDGFTVTIIGCIHRSRTLSYGFSPEVCDHFHSGFPCDWEVYTAKSSHEKHESSLPLSFDDLPVTRTRDILMSTARESEACAFTSLLIKDLPKQCNENSFNQTASSVLSHEIIEEACEINSFPVELSEEGVGSLKETEAARVSSRAGALPEFCEEHFDSFSKPKLLVMTLRDQYPLRSKRMKKSD